MVGNYQRENVMMFSHIMEKLKDKEENVSEIDTNFDDPDFSFEHFPCVDIEQLTRLNMLCATKPTVKKILVSIKGKFFLFLSSDYSFLYIFYRKRNYVWFNSTTKLILSATC